MYFGLVNKKRPNYQQLLKNYQWFSGLESQYFLRKLEIFFLKISNFLKNVSKWIKNMFFLIGVKNKTIKVFWAKSKPISIFFLGKIFSLFDDKSFFVLFLMMINLYLKTFFIELPITCMVIEIDHPLYQIHGIQGDSLK